MASSLNRRVIPVAHELVFRHDTTATEPSDDELYRSQTFANEVAVLVNQAYVEFISGQTKTWKGPKYAALIDLYYSDNYAYALPHVGNAMEERVYALMNAKKLSESWSDQDTTVLGSGTRPDISVMLSQSPYRYALYDITSKANHIHDKSPPWTNKKHICYVAELVFPSVTWPQLESAMKNSASGGINADTALKMKEEAEQKRLEEELAFSKSCEYVRNFYNQYPTFSGFSQNVFDGDKREAATFLGFYNIRNQKGMPSVTANARREFGDYKGMQVDELKEMFEE